MTRKYESQSLFVKELKLSFRDGFYTCRLSISLLFYLQEVVCPSVIVVKQPKVLQEFDLHGLESDYFADDSSSIGSVTSPCHKFNFDLQDEVNERLLTSSDEDNEDGENNMGSFDSPSPKKYSKKRLRKRLAKMLQCEYEI